MRIRFSALATLAALGFSLCLPAHADIIDVFNASGTLSGSAGTATLSGTVTIDTYLGTATAQNLTVNFLAPFCFAPGACFNTPASLVFSQAFTLGSNVFGTSDTSFGDVVVTPAFGTLDLYIAGTPVGYTGGALSSNTSFSVTVVNMPPTMESYKLTSGSLALLSSTGTNPLPPVNNDPPAVTPEPSSLVLLGTGMASLAGLARRRFLRA